MPGMLRAGRALDERSHVVRANGIDSAALAELLQRDPEVEYAVVDHRRHRLVVPNDPLYSQGPVLGQRTGGPLGEVQIRVRLQPSLALVQASLPLTHTALASTPLHGWLNLHAVLRQTDGLPAVERLRVGRLPVPGWLVEALLPRLLSALDLGAQGELAQRLVRRVVFRPQQLVLAYAWPDNAEQALSDSLLPPAEQQRLRAYADRLARLTGELTPPGQRHSAGVDGTAAAAPVRAGTRAQHRRRQRAA